MRRSILLAVLAATCAASATHAEVRLPRANPRASVAQTIGLTNVGITYGRPAVNGRTLWGDLVPWEEAWSPGADEPTAISFSDAVKIHGDRLPAGTYLLYAFVAKNHWTLVFNSGTTDNYEPEQDVLRVDVKPEAAEPQEWLRYSFENLRLGGADLVLRWERVRIAVPIETDDVARALELARTAVAMAPHDDWRTFYQAASFLSAYGLEPELAEQWALKAATLSPDYANLMLLATIKAAAGDTKTAAELSQRAIRLGRDAKLDTRVAEHRYLEWSEKK